MADNSCEFGAIFLTKGLAMRRKFRIFASIKEICFFSYSG